MRAIHLKYWPLVFWKLYKYVEMLATWRVYVVKYGSCLFMSCNCAWQRRGVNSPCLSYESIWKGSSSSWNRLCKINFLITDGWKRLMKKSPIASILFTKKCCMRASVCTYKGLWNFSASKIVIFYEIVLMHRKTFL